MRPGQVQDAPMWVEILYSNGNVVRVTTLAEWAAAPSNGLLGVRAPINKSYQLSPGDWRYFTYRCSSYDYYWLDSTGPKQGQAGNVPANLPLGVAKRGASVPDAEWVAAYNSWVSQDYPAPGPV